MSNHNKIGKKRLGIRRKSFDDRKLGEGYKRPGSQSGRKQA